LYLLFQTVQFLNFLDELVGVAATLPALLNLSLPLALDIHNIACGIPLLLMHRALVVVKQYCEIL